MILPQFSSLKTLLMLTLAAMSVVPLVASGLASHHRASSEIARRESDLLHTISEQTCRMLDRIVFERAGDAVEFSKHPNARLEPRKVTAVANEYLPVFGFYDLMVVADSDGKIIATNTIDNEGKPIDTSGLIGKSVRGEEWFESCISGKTPPGETFIAEASRDPIATVVRGKPELWINFATPVVDQTGKVVRVWSNRASWERMIRPILVEQEADMKTNGRPDTCINLISRSGWLLYDADPAAILSLNCNEQGLEAANRGTKGEAGYTIENHPRTGTLQANGYAQCKGFGGVPGTGWVCLVRRDYESVISPAIAIRDSAMITGLIVVGVALLLSYWLASSIATPIRLAAEGIQQLAVGNLSSRLTIRRRDEIGRMAISINETAAGISSALGMERIDWQELGSEWRKMLASRVDLQRITAMLEQAPTNVLFADTDFKIRYVNATTIKTLRGLEQFLPVRADELLGQSIDIFNRNPEHQRRLFGDKGRLPPQADIQIGGETLSVLVNPILDDQRKPMGWMVYLEVITEKRRMEKEIAENIEKARAAAADEKLRGEELCLKVDAILGVVQGLAEGDFSREVHDLGNDAVGRVGTALNQAVSSMRETLVQVKEAAEALVTASQELSGASMDISSGAQEQVSSLEETASRLEEMILTIRQNSDSAQQARQFAEGSREVAEKGGSVVQSAVEAMGEINRSSKKIAAIIVTIDEIAFQTNLLALNAAVEAARAGEEGRGFAVVAGEVRNLAQRSAGAAREIKSLIQDSVRKIASGTELVNQSGSTLTEIVGSVNRVTDIVSEIAAASKEQSIGIEQINHAVTHMGSITQRNASQTEELSGTSQSLAGLAAQLIEVVNRFRIGSETPSIPTPSHAIERAEIVRGLQPSPMKFEMLNGERFETTLHHGQDRGPLIGFEEF